ncbi:MAG TPA: HoxN/HupN/NixA family nickel/cobalt transporter [Rhodopila sp.]
MAGMSTATGGLYAVLIAANLGAWLWAWWAFADQPTLLGTALLAWVFGLRHAIDADHITAIDNVVRKLVHGGGRGDSVGFYFSLGHSTVVILASAAIAATTAAMQHRLASFREAGGMIGTAVSAMFLLVIAGANLLILRDVWRSFQRVSAGATLEDASLNTMLIGPGILARLCRPLFRMVTRGWHMYLVGFLFGLGFDTATEVGLIGISASQASRGMSPWQTLVFPALFTAAMALVDTTDSVLMTRAYGWALIRPLRKLWYNLTLTAVSVIVAVLIGSVEGLGLLAGHLGLEGRLWSWITRLNDDLTNFGFAVVGIFLCAWALSVLIYRWKGYDARDPGVIGSSDRAMR